MLVDDYMLSKKKVDLIEPIWISGSDSEATQIVVNSISKGRAHGYVSAPKYPQSPVVAASASSSSSTQNPMNPSPTNEERPQATPSNPQ